VVVVLVVSLTPVEEEVAVIPFSRILVDQHHILRLVVVGVDVVTHQTQQDLVEMVVQVAALVKTNLEDLEPKVMHHHLLDMVMMVEVLEDQTMDQVAVVQEAQL
jgi:hypothetical protein|tara:strand:+ start:97 stop:408 length:312 start_codon:yes stop_codon:yes gene_type:complete